MTLDVSDATSIKLNGQDVTKISDGVNTLWEKATPISSPLRVVNNVAGSAITFTLTRNGSPADIDIEYSTDNVNWTTWTETNGVRSMSIAKSGNLYLRGNNPNGINPLNNDTDYYSFNADKKYAMAGDIRSLISRYEIDTLPYCAFGRLFKNSTTLDNFGYVRLSATKLGDYCYSQMFYGCTGLRFSPHVLPATNVPARGYDNMFCNCTSLGTMPIIRGTSFGINACRKMFYGCSSLVKQWTSETPSDETTTSSISFTISSSDSHSFREMFRGCALWHANGIVATQTEHWKNNVCQDMFYGCTELQDVPQITFASFDSGESHCQQMFYNCSNITSAQSIGLTAKTLYYATCKGMFRGCSFLTTPPKIEATTMSADTNNGSLAQIFYGCVNLTDIWVRFTDWNNGLYTNNWTYGCPSMGRFYRPSALSATKNASGNTTNPHYIPYNWVVNINPGS